MILFLRTNIARSIGHVNGLAFWMEYIKKHGPYGHRASDFHVRDEERKFEHVIFDRYFGLVRLNMNALDLLGCACALALSDFSEIKKNEPSYRIDEADSIIAGILTIVRWVIVSGGDNKMLTYSITPPDPNANHDAILKNVNISDNHSARVLHRWCIGHRIFFVLIQGIIHCSKRLAEETSPRKTARLATELNIVLTASRAAMQFASDMSPADYADIVRPDMASVSPIFSGLFLEDHAVMLSDFKKIGVKLVEKDRLKLKETVSEVYDAHASVCEHAVGLHNESLLSGRPQACERSAGNDLRTRWKTRALSRLEPRTERHE
jgi:hypothetical protein